MHYIDIITCNGKHPNTECPKIGVQTMYLLPYRECLNVHEKNMEKIFPTKKSIIFIIIINGNTM
jgi:hypothetical protein